jgi:hypothetical protein
MILRAPTPAAELYAWHTAITAGWHPLTPVGEPQVGWFKRRLIKNGIYVPARIWLEQDIDETTGELMDDERLLCEVAGERRDPLDEWTWLCGIRSARQSLTTWPPRWLGLHGTPRTPPRPTRNAR